MIKFCRPILKNIAEFLDRYFVAVTILLGISFLAVGIHAGNDEDWLSKLLYTIGSVSLTSGIFTGIAKSNQFTEIYKKIVRDIIYGNEHLEKRNDLEQIWENVTHTLSNKKFQKISRVMNKNIKKYFLPLEHDYYYDNFNIDISVECHPENKDYLIMKETTSFTIICDDQELKIHNKYKSTTKVDLANIGLSNTRLNKLTIDGVVQKDINLKTELEKNVLVLSYEKELSGRKSYNIKRETEKTFDINYNPIKKQLAVWIYNGCALDINYPKGLTIEIHSLGVLDDFKIEDKSGANFNRLKATYTGLIYKNQGFFMLLR